MDTPTDVIETPVNGMRRVVELTHLIGVGIFLIHFATVIVLEVFQLLGSDLSLIILGASGKTHLIGFAGAVIGVLLLISKRCRPWAGWTLLISAYLIGFHVFLMSYLSIPTVTYRIIGLSGGVLGIIPVALCLSLVKSIVSFSFPETAIQWVALSFLVWGLRWIGFHFMELRKEERLVGSSIRSLINFPNSPGGSQSVSSRFVNPSSEDKRTGRQRVMFAFLFIWAGTASIVWEAELHSTFTITALVYSASSAFGIQLLPLLTALTARKIQLFYRFWSVIYVLCTLIMIFKTVRFR